MMFPGGNILALANRVISPQCVQYRPFVSRALNSAGVLVPKWSSPCTLNANVQPVPRSRYEVMGLDFQKNYATIYVQKNVVDIARDVTGDQFWYSGKLYQVESRTDWFAQDGWDAILCVEVPGYTPPFPAEESDA
jgi:hypothetical protein